MKKKHIVRHARTTASARFRRFLTSAAFGSFLAITPVAGSAPLLDEPITPLPPIPTTDSKRAALGERLFHDKRLSRDATVSCATCHVLARGGVDGLARSRGVNQAEGNINAPTVFNSGLNFVQFWDGRAESLEAQVEGPIHNPAEMASSWDHVLGQLRQDPTLVAQFAASYRDGLTAANISNAIATFERTLATPDSPFDRYLAGDDRAIGPQAKRGYLYFKSYGCTSCHQGAAVGGNMYQSMGVFKNYFTDRGRTTTADLGRYNVTHDERDRYVFKVPGLRLAALTAPYFHDGSADTLDQAIDIMARYQLGRPIPPSRREDIAAFLRSLVGQHPRLTP